MKTYTICGSMRFEKEMKKLAYDLEIGKGYNILQCVFCEKDVVPTDEELLRLADAHFRKIDLSDGIYVVNIDGYIGESVKKKLSMLKKMVKKWCIIIIDKFQFAKFNLPFENCINKTKKPLHGQIQTVAFPYQHFRLPKGESLKMPVFFMMFFKFVRSFLVSFS